MYDTVRPTIGKVTSILLTRRSQVKGSDWLGDQDAIHYMCREAPQAIIEVRCLDTWLHFICLCA